MREGQKLRGFFGPNERGLRMTIPNVRASNPNRGKLDYATKSMTTKSMTVTVVPKTRGTKLECL